MVYRSSSLGIHLSVAFQNGTVGEIRSRANARLKTHPMQIRSHTDSLWPCRLRTQYALRCAPIGQVIISPTNVLREGPATPLSHSTYNGRCHYSHLTGGRLDHLRVTRADVKSDESTGRKMCQEHGLWTTPHRLPLVYATMFQGCALQIHLTVPRTEYKSFLKVRGERYPRSGTRELFSGGRIGSVWHGETS